MIGYVAPPLDEDEAVIGVNVDLKESQRTSKNLKKVIASPGRTVGTWAAWWKDAANAEENCDEGVAAVARRSRLGSCGGKGALAECSL